jgi:hypothetical protein
VVAEPGTVPIADALNALHGDEPGPPDERIRRLGALPLVCQPDERWMYYTAAADVTGVLIARSRAGPSVTSCASGSASRSG